MKWTSSRSGHSCSQNIHTALWKIQNINSISLAARQIEWLLFITLSTNAIKNWFFFFFSLHNFKFLYKSSQQCLSHCTDLCKKNLQRRSGVMKWLPVGNSAYQSQLIRLCTYLTGFNPHLHCTPYSNCSLSTVLKVQGAEKILPICIWIQCSWQKAWIMQELYITYCQAILIWIHYWNMAVPSSYLYQLFSIRKKNLSTFK